MIAPERLDQHFAASIEVLVEHADGSGRVEQHGDVLVAAVGRGGTEFNVGWVTGVPADPEADLRWLLDRLTSLDCPFMVQLADPYRTAMEPALASARLVLEETVPGMVRSATDDVPAPPDALRVEQVRDADALRAHALAVAAGFGAPEPETVLPVFPTSLMDDDRVSLFSGYVDDSGRPVATAVCVVAEGLAGVYAVTVLDEFRRRGMGAAMTWAAVAAGARAGVHGVALQATVMGRPVYSRMGFETVRAYHRYTPGR